MEQIFFYFLLYDLIAFRNLYVNGPLGVQRKGDDP